MQGFGITFAPHQGIAEGMVVHENTIDYTGVSADTWRRFSTSGAMASFFRDNIEESYSERRVR